MEQQAGRGVGRGKQLCHPSTILIKNKTGTAKFAQHLTMRRRFNWQPLQTLHNAALQSDAAAAAAPLTGLAKSRNMLLIYFLASQASTASSSPAQLGSSSGSLMVSTLQQVERRERGVEKVQRGVWQVENETKE